MRDSSSGYLTAPPHQRQSNEGAWGYQKATRPPQRIKEELKMSSQGGPGTGQCHGLSLDRVSGYRHGTGAHTPVANAVPGEGKWLWAGEPASTPCSNGFHTGYKKL